MSNEPLATVDPDSPPTQEILEGKAQKPIPLVEMFGPTIQGEGNVLGQQTYFLRFGLCDYKCTMCDSLHAVLPQLVKRNAKWLTQEDIFQALTEFRKPNSTNWVTFSGGNPAIHDLGYLLGRLKMAGWKVNVETQGTRWMGWLGKVDNLTISPKPPGMGEQHDQKVFDGFLDKLYESGLFPHSDQWYGPNLCIKMPVFNQIDLEFASEVIERLMQNPLFTNWRLKDYFYLSLGNPHPPSAEDRSNPDFSHRELLESYRQMFEDIQSHPILSNVKFLPQWHTFAFGNTDGH